MALCASWLQAQAPVGTVAGYVYNEATGSALSGARVALEDEPQSVVHTDDAGMFRLHGVSPGEHTLVVEYTGLDTARSRVNVEAGKTAMLTMQLTSGIYEMEAFTVSSVREGQAMAISRQRAADHIKTVVAADAFGNVADTNVGNLLSKLSGINAVAEEGDVVQVSVRGISPGLNSISVDGTLMAGASTRGDSNNRALEIDKISTNTIESIEIIKAPRPDMDADAIGGKINLRTKSALDRPRREIQYSLGGNMYLERERTHPSGSFVFSDVLGAGNRLGLTFSGSFNRTFSPRSSARLQYQNATLEAPAAISRAEVSEDDIRKDRISTGTKFDYKLSDTTRLFFNVVYNNYEDLMRQHKQRLRPGTVTSFDDVFTEWVNGRLEYELESRVKTVKTLTFKTGGKSELGDYQFDYDVSYSDSHATEKREDLTLRINGMGYRIDRTGRLHYPTMPQISGPDPADFDRGTIPGVNTKDFHAWDSVAAAQFDVQRKLKTSWPLTLKSGLRYRGQEKRRDRAQDVWSYVGPDGRAGPVSGVNDDNLNRFRGDGHGYAPLDGRYPLIAWPNLDAVHEERRRQPGLFSYNAADSFENRYVNDSRAEENIYAAYLQGQVKIGVLSVLAGTRFEETRTTGTGARTDLDAATLEERFGRTDTVRGKYTNAFPSIHVRYEPVERLIMRASYSTAIGRPGFDQLVPETEVDEIDQRISMNNPSLKPQYSDNFDLSAEYYFRNIGAASISLFRKNITNFRFNVEEVVGAGAANGFGGRYEGYILRTKHNGGWAHVNGIELNYQHQLTFLPGFLNGFGVYANATFLDTKGTYGGDVVMNEVEGFIKRTGNLGVSYIKHGFTVRTSLNYSGRGMLSYNSNPARRTYQEPRTSVDFSVKYAFSPRLAVYFDVNNVFNEKYIQYFGLPIRPADTQIYGTRLSAGIGGTF